MGPHVEFHPTSVAVEVPAAHADDGGARADHLAHIENVCIWEWVQHRTCDKAIGGSKWPRQQKSSLEKIRRKELPSSFCVRLQKPRACKCVMPAAPKSRTGNGYLIHTPNASWP